MISKIKRKAFFLKKMLSNQLWYKTTDGRKNVIKLERLRNSFSGNRCFIMGNGPSLLNCDLTLLKNEVTIASNAQYLIWDQMGFVPTFLSVEDRLVAEDRRHELNAIRTTTKLFPIDLSQFLGYDSNTIYLNFIRDYKPFPQFSDDFAKRVYWGGTVSMLNLQLAYFLGCNPIYLIGFDHSYKVPSKIKGCVITSEHDDENHIHPDYFGKGYRWHDPNVARMEQAYQERRFLESRNVTVINATVGGQLEVFKRVEYLTLFPKS
jgi:hypothetical protein